MDKALVKVEPLQAVLKGLTRGQKDFLTYRIIGIEPGQALRILQRKTSTLEGHWKYDEAFKEVEAEVLANRELYIHEASAEIATSTVIMVDKALYELALMALDWGSVKQGDKPYVMKALELLKKIQLPMGKGDIVYEEWVKRVRRIE